MTDEFAVKLAQVIKLHPGVLDENGKIIVSAEALAKINAANPEPQTDHERAELYRQAQSETILALWSRTMN